MYDTRNFLYEMMVTLYVIALLQNQFGNLIGVVIIFFVNLQLLNFDENCINSKGATNFLIHILLVFFKIYLLLA